MARYRRVARLNQTLLPFWDCFGMDQPSYQIFALGTPPVQPQILASRSNICMHVFSACQMLNPEDMDKYMLPCRQGLGRRLIGTAHTHVPRFWSGSVRATWMSSVLWGNA